MPKSPQTASAPADKSLDLFGEVRTPPVVILENLRVADEGGGLSQPLNLFLGRGEKALIAADNASLIQELIKAVLALKSPAAGRAFFRMKRADTRQSTLERADMYRRIGLLSEICGMVSGMSALDNLLTFLHYHAGGGGAALRKRAEAILRSLGFSGRMMSVVSSSLSRTYRMLGSCALAVAKEPELIILERPRHYLGRLFDGAWRAFEELREGNGTAVMVAALRKEPYSDLDFSQKLGLGF
jgi:ABC-type transporter Mla maintaining outer membrane lipid asymmetry ATPase subunit MlaF